MMLTQHLTSRDSNSAGILVPVKLAPRAHDRFSRKNRDSGETFREKLALGL